MHVWLKRVVVSALVLGTHVGPIWAADETAKCYATCTKLVAKTIASFNKCILKDPAVVPDCLQAASSKSLAAWQKPSSCGVFSCQDKLPSTLRLACRNYVGDRGTELSSGAYGPFGPTRSNIEYALTEAYIQCP